MICPVCKKPSDNVRAAVKNGKYISERCDRCLSLAVSSAVYARKFERDAQAKTFRRDLIQPLGMDGKINPEYVKEYPEQAKKQFGDDVVTLR